MYPFRMYGRSIQICTYSVQFTNGEDTEKTEKRYCCSYEEALAIAALNNGAIQPLENENYMWMDGIEVADVPDTFSEAVRIYEMGEAAYLEELNQPTEADYLVELDYRLSKLELGV